MKNFFKRNSKKGLVTNKNSITERANITKESARKDLIKDLNFKSEEEKERFLKQKEFIDKILE